MHIQRSGGGERKLIKIIKKEQEETERRKDVHTRINDCAPTSNSSMKQHVLRTYPTYMIKKYREDSLL